MSTSAQLRSQIDAFSERAERIIGHPLADAAPSIKLNVTLDPTMGEVRDIQFDHDNLDRDSWEQLASLERSIIFNRTDPLSVERFTTAIAREHEGLRQPLKALRTDFVAWTKSTTMGFKYLEPGEERALPGGWTNDNVEVTRPDGTVTGLWTGEPGTFPDTVDAEGFESDWAQAEIYFNGSLWHSDTDKIERWQAASELGKKHMMKCAELVTIHGVTWVRHVRQIIADARSAGYDL